MKPTAFIGCDPGYSGAIVVLNNSRPSCVIPVMLEHGEPNLWLLKNLITNCIMISPVVCVIEKVFRPNKLVYCAGMLEGMLASFPMEVHRIAPSTWRKGVFGKAWRNYEKEHSIKFCQKHYPELSLLREHSKVPDHNIAEAIVIAHYAKIKFGQ